MKDLLLFEVQQEQQKKLSIKNKKINKDCERVEEKKEASVLKGTVERENKKSFLRSTSQLDIKCCISGFFTCLTFSENFPHSRLCWPSLELCIINFIWGEQQAMRNFFLPHEFHFTFHFSLSSLSLCVCVWLRAFDVFFMSSSRAQNKENFHFFKSFSSSPSLFFAAFLSAHY
jgi:hypothetical protein